MSFSEQRHTHPTNPCSDDNDDYEYFTNTCVCRGQMVYFLLEKVASEIKGPQKKA